MEIREALQNIYVVVSNARMSSPEHDTLKQSMSLVQQRCKRADELEKEKREIKKEVE